jgi:predicted aminopeptidase
MWIALCALSVLASGCYYGHLARGQTRLLWARESLDDVLSDEATPDDLRRKLELVTEAREAARALGLDVDEQYTTFVPWEGDRMVTTVVATPEGSVDPAPFWFPIVGHVPYKGYFDESRAQREAQRLQEKGFDTCLFAVDAYSTLGFMDDPVTQPMLAREDGAIVELIVHELVHATFYVKSQPDFNEGAAQFLGQEAAVRHFAGDPEAVARERARIRERRLLSETLLGFREELRGFHAEVAERRARGESPDVEALRADLEADMRRRLAALPLERRDPARLAEGIRLNDACLALQGTYGADLERHAAKLEEMGGDLPAYVAALEAAAQERDPRAAFFGLDPMQPADVPADD